MSETFTAGLYQGAHMLIRGVHASNFMSFAPELDGFHLENLSERMTILVGPNGAGKSSVFRAVQAIIDAMTPPTPGREPVLPNPSSLYYRPSGFDTPIHVALDVSFDRPDEQELLRLFWQNSLLYPSGQSFQGFMTIPKQETEQGNVVVPQRFSRYEQWIEDNISCEDLAPLYHGRLVLEMDPRAVLRTTLTYECNGTSMPIAIDLTGHYSTLGALSFPGPTKPTAGASLAVAIVRSLPNDLDSQLAKFFDGQDVPFPDLPSMSWTRLASYCKQHPQILDTGLSHQGSEATPELRVQLSRILGRPAHDTQSANLADVMRHLVQKALICVETSVELTLEASLDPAEHRSPAETLSMGNLALYLFHLKNGSPDDRQLFKEIRETYQRLTRTNLDVVLNFTPRQTRYGQQPVETPEKFTATVTSDMEIPLRYSGSGRSMVAFLSALVHQHAGKVILLDEPDAHLHPTLQAELAKAFSNSGRQGQYIIITHSPYMLPPGELENVRRIYLVPGKRSSTASQRFTENAVKSLNLRKRGKEPDDAMFLFSKATVFVEGANDAAALAVWFDSWAERHGQLSGEGARAGLRFQAVGGKAGIIPWMRIAGAYGVPCIALYDADVLHPNPSRKKRKPQRPQRPAKNENEAVLHQWEDAGLVEPGQVSLGDEKAIQLFPDCAGGRIFLCGKTLEDDLEQLPVFEEHFDEALEEVGGGPLVYRFIAKRYPYPPDYEGLFENLFRTAAALVAK